MQSTLLQKNIFLKMYIRTQYLSQNFAIEAWIRIRTDLHSINTMDPDRDFGLGPDPHETDADPKHWP
jgi:hypothetical protein